MARSSSIDRLPAAVKTMITATGAGRELAGCARAARSGLRYDAAGFAYEPSHRAVTAVIGPRLVLRLQRAGGRPARAVRGAALVDQRGVHRNPRGGPGPAWTERMQRRADGRRPLLRV